MQARAACASPARLCIASPPVHRLVVRHLGGDLGQHLGILDSDQRVHTLSLLCGFSIACILNLYRRRECQKTGENSL